MPDSSAVKQQFLALSDVKQKVIALQVLSGFKWWEDYVLGHVEKEAISGNTSFPYSALNKLYRSLKQGGLTQNGDTLLPEVAYHIAMIASQSDWPHVSNVVRTIANKQPLSLPNYGTRALVPPISMLTLGVFLNDSAPFVFDKRRSPLQYNYDIKLLHGFLYYLPLDMSWLCSRAPIIQAYICVTKLLFMVVNQKRRAIDYGKIRKVYESLPFSELKHDYLYYFMIQIDVGLGDIAAASKKLAMISDQTSSYALLSQSLLACFSGEHAKSTSLLESGLPLIKKQYAKRNFCFHDTAGLFYFFQKICVDDMPGEALYEMSFYEKQGQVLGFNITDDIALLRMMAKLNKGDKDSVESELKRFHHTKPNNPLTRVFYELLHYAVNTHITPTREEELIKMMTNYRTYKFQLGAQVAAEIILSAKPDHPLAQKMLDESSIDLRFLPLLKAKDPWEYNMLKLESMLLPVKAGQKKLGRAHVASKRLLWLVDPDKLDVSVLEQSSRKAGGWTGGRAISLEKLHDSPERYTYLTEEDKRALRGLRENYESGWYGGRDYYYFEKDSTILALVGHPTLYHLHNREMQIELEHADPYLCISHSPYALA